MRKPEKHGESRRDAGAVNRRADGQFKERWWHKGPGQLAMAMGRARCRDGRSAVTETCCPVAASQLPARSQRSRGWERRGEETVERRSNDAVARRQHLRKRERIWLAPGVARVWGGVWRRAAAVDEERGRVDARSPGLAAARRPLPAVGHGSRLMCALCRNRRYTPLPPPRIDDAAKQSWCVVVVPCPKKKAKPRTSSGPSSCGSTSALQLCPRSPHRASLRGRDLPQICAARPGSSRVQHAPTGWVPCQASARARLVQSWAPVAAKVRLASEPCALLCLCAPVTPVRSRCWLPCGGVLVTPGGCIARAQPAGDSLQAHPHATPGRNALAHAAGPIQPIPILFQSSHSIPSTRPTPPAAFPSPYPACPACQPASLPSSDGHPPRSARARARA